MVPDFDDRQIRYNDHLTPVVVVDFVDSHRSLDSPVVVRSAVDVRSRTVSVGLSHHYHRSLERCH